MVRGRHCIRKRYPSGVSPYTDKIRLVDNKRGFPTGEFTNTGKFYTSDFMLMKEMLFSYIKWKADKGQNLFSNWVE